MCKHLENDAKLPISSKYAEKIWHRATAPGDMGFVRLPVVRLRHGPIAVMRAGLWSRATALAARATRAGMWCDFEKRHQASALATPVVSSV